MSTAPQFSPLKIASPSFGIRWRAMTRTGVRMMLHDKLKFFASIAGVVFAVVLAVQQLSLLMGLLQKNTQFIDNCNADIWITPPNIELLAPGDPLSDQLVMTARTTPGVRDAAPLLLGGGILKKPDGGSMPVQIVGVEMPVRMGGPYSMVAGSIAALDEPDTLVFEDSERERFGGLNLGSIREINGHLVRVGAFTWGLIPFGPAYTFADMNFARELTRTPSDKESFVLVNVRDRNNISAVAAELQKRMPKQLVISSTAFSHMIAVNLLKQQLGVSFGLSTLIGLIVGFVIVALTMFSSVVDNLREFGMLKAIGCTNGDLTKLLLVQSIVYALVGSFIGFGFATQAAAGIRSPKLVPIIPVELYWIVPASMVALCISAAALALMRIRKLEPGMVFR